ncbi:MAG: AMP-dependent synthetase/ligase [Acidobacteriaceae bacterium]
MLDLKTLNDVFSRATSHGDQPVMQWRDGNGRWQNITSAQLYQRVRSLALVLASWGIGKGDRVAILSENRWEWAVTDFAALALGAVDVPLYGTSTAEQVAAMLADSGSRVVVVSTPQQYEKVVAIRQQTVIEKIVLMDHVPELAQATWFGDLMPGGNAAPSDSDTARDPGFDRRASEVQADDLATIIYTSGTTGESKGVMLTHGNFASNLNLSTAPFALDRKHSSISFLPLSHVTARHVDYSLFAQNATLAYCPNFDVLPQVIREVRPTIFVGVPRVYEKIRQEVLRRAAESPVRKRMLEWALRIGHRHHEEVEQGKAPSSLLWKLCDRLVYAKIREGFGGQVAYFISGGAPLGMDTASWFVQAGIRIYEGYGLTETSPIITLNYPQAYRIGSVGKVLPNLQVRLAEDGELLVRGPSIFIGYWNSLEHNLQLADAFTPDGFFKTGDIARIDDDGFVFITDRKKELLKTSGGKFIAPQPIEGKLKADVLVGQACVVGDKHKFACVLLSPNFLALEAWARSKGIGAADHKALVQHPLVLAAYQQIVDHVNAELPSYETLKRFYLVAEEWSLETGELTSTLKLKRRIIQERYAQEIARLYADEATVQRNSAATPQVVSR